MATYFCAYGVAFVASILLTPLLARLARPLRLIDAPGPRKVHRTGIPNSGGAAVFLATTAAALLTIITYGTVTEAASAPLGRLLCLLLPGTGIFLLGLVDDIRNVPARWKLAGQLAAAVAVCLCGIRLNLAAFWPNAPLPAAWLGWPVTVLWIVSVMNAINLIDGLDALAGGLSMIACVAVAFAGLSADQPVVVVVTLAALGGLSGFLPYNLHPARVFLGDSGSLFLGFVVATASIMVTTGRSAQPQWFLLPLVALAIPLMEMTITTLRRLLRRRPIFVADRGHVHHRLLDLGFSQQGVV
ncbi:MAG: undecaprenyl/decaprenyl-phosphate alpha-N-acetylglucosaminyl 1-phosphate transferase, partial [Phycisphaerae bacterium]|nr:undecaprenyl/decaprenyl-phosphate alpha-N-acetylglucosaminyl 1-phosphate transferase [Phycisphaerae bacterium]